MPAVRELRDHFWQLLRDAFGDRVVLNGHPDERLPNTLNVSFVGQSGVDILFSHRSPDTSRADGSYWRKLGGF